jgi:hypothetical protein
VLLTLGSLYPAAADVPARALVFPQNPERTPSPEVIELPLPPSGPHLRHPWFEVLTCGGTDSRDGRGPCRPRLSATAGPDGVYAHTPADIPGSPAALDDPHAEVSAFFHASRTFRFFAAAGLAPPWPNGRAPLRVVVNVLQPDRPALRLPFSEHPAIPWGNSLFVSPADPAASGSSDFPHEGRDTVWLGQGAQTDFAYDGDAVVHETTHAILSHVLPRGEWRLDDLGLDPAPAAIREALADYVAASLADDPLIGEYARRNGEAWHARTLACSARCPDSLSGRRHADSLVLSCALWRARVALGPAPPGAVHPLDRAVVRATVSFRGGSAPSLSAFAAALLRGVPSPTRRLVERELTAAAILPSCRRILPLDPAQTLRSSADRFLAPGVATAGSPLIAPGIVQLHLAVPQGTMAIRLWIRAGELPTSGDLEREPFLPTLLARWDTPIRWSPRKGTSNADITLPLEGEAQTRTARISPARGGDLFLQVANRSRRDGWWNEVRIAFER